MANIIELIGEKNMSTWNENMTDKKISKTWDNTNILTLKNITIKYYKFLLENSDMYKIEEKIYPSGLKYLLITKLY